MSPDEEQTLERLLQKQKEEQGAPVLQLLQGGGEKNVIVAKLEEFAAMARRGEVFDFAVALVLQPQDGAQRMTFAWGSKVPTLQIVGAAATLQFHLCNSMPTTV